MSPAPGAPTPPSAIAANVAEVRERIGAAARTAGRDPDSVRLVAATKTRTVSEIRTLLAAGVTDVGENRAQELVAKAPVLSGGDPPPVWHFIGRLQRNKINPLAPWVTWWQSVDRSSLAGALAARIRAARVLVEVNIGGESQKGGVAPEAAPGLVDECRTLGLDVAGLMTVAPSGGDPRPVFAALAALGTRLELTELSMGMSGDYEAAVAEGATIVRLGTALFGPRT